MNCPKCGAPVSSRRSYCDSCGTDITVYRRIVRLSNAYYNEGLDKAKVRDLSGAAVALRKSLELNKNNTDARNLLGLVYYEMGETVAALSQWVISKNFKGEENDADMYLEMVQDNPNELDNVNQAIRKYNLALEEAKQSHDDLAILQLKKAVSLHGNFLRAIHLLSLLLIKAGEYNKAQKYLDRALAIDVANTTTLRYIAEIETATGESRNERSRSETDKNNSSGKGIEVRSSYHEDKPNAMAFINLLLGVLIGIVVVYYLIVPTIKNNIREEYDSQKVDYSSELSTKNATITQHEKKIASLERQVADLQAELDNVTSEVVEVVTVDTAQYNAFFDAWKAYKSLKAREYSDEELQQLALQLWAIDMTGIDNDSALSILNEMRNDIYPLAARKIYKAGKALYDNGEYDAASGMLEAAVAFNGENDAAMYYLGKTYQALARYEDAIHYYKLMVEVCPNSTLKEYIPQRLRECGATE